MPEVTRALALRGAELIFMPAGTDKGKLWASWRNLIWSRAIENLAIVVTTQNLFSHAERGLAMVAAPEEILFESTAAGLFVVDVSLERAREMRAITRQRHLLRAISAPSRACLGRNGSGRNCARPCIRGPTARKRRTSADCRPADAIAALRHVRRANFRAACPLAPISARSPASATRKAASSAPPSGAPTTPRWRGWRPTPRRRLCDRRRTDRAQEGRARSTIRCSRRTRRARSAPTSETVFLGLLDGAGRFGIGIAPAAAEALKARDDLLVTDLRSIAVQGLVDAEHLPPLAEAKAMLHWHARHRFCSNCGARDADSSQAGWRRDCPACKARAFPAHRSGGDHAGGRRRALPARPLARVSCRPCGRASPASSSRAKRSRTRCGAKRSRRPASPAAG